MDRFLIRLVDERNPRVAVGQSVDFYAYFPTITDSSSHIVFKSHVGSVNIQYGDGTGDDTGLQTFDPPNAWGGLGAATHFTHVYKKPGTFTASVKGGSVQPCAIKPGLAPITVNVRDPYQNVVKEKASVGDPHAFIAGKIERAGMVTERGAGQIVQIVQIEGSGHCSLKMFEELDGVPLQQYDYDGPLPTKIVIRGTVHYVNGPSYYSVAYGTHVLKIAGDKTFSSCAGSASVSLTVHAPGHVETVQPSGRAKTR